jgi:hypothetical protein
MKLLTNRTGSYLTGDELADAVMRYSLALARRRELDVVDIPFITDDGGVRRVELPIGWSANTTATSSAERGQELTESDTARQMNEKAARIATLRAYPFTPDELDRLRGQHHVTADWI